MTLALIAFWGAVRPVASAQRPQDVLAKVKETYASLHSYTDWGSVAFSYRSWAGERAGERRTFNTTFRQPTQIRYEFVEPATEIAREKRWITWTSVRGAYATWTNWLPNEVNHIPLAKSLYRSWGMAESCGLSLKLLAPWAVGGFLPTDLSEATLESATVRGQSCWRIDGRCPDGALASVWIESRSWLIVRYRHQIAAKLDGTPTDEIYTVELHPAANPKLSDRDLRFVPKSSGKSHRSHKHKRRHRRR